MTAIDLNIPILETPRLILRGHKLGDFDPLVAIWSDPIVLKHFHGPVLTREEHWAKFLRLFGIWALLGYGMWAIEEKSTGEYIGATGIFDVKRELDPALDGVPEAGWTLAARCHGKGYATEATHAALGWVDGNLAHRLLFCIIATTNAASIRVAEKCGFQPRGETIYKEEPTLIFLRESN
jgi:RimJ/RimL family protein N-acetyltransferase